MLTFEQKTAILDSYPELERKQVSLGRLNYHFENSLYDKKTVASHIHPNGNGFVFAGFLEGYPLNDKGLVNVRDFSESELRSLIEASIRSLSERAPEEEAKPKRRRKKHKPQLWSDQEGHTLELKYEDDMWFIYAGLNLDSVFETIEEAEEYLREEGFEPSL